VVSSILLCGSIVYSVIVLIIPSDLVLVLNILKWTVPILSWLHHSRLGAFKLWALTSRSFEVARSLDLCHLFSLDGWLRSSRGFTTHDLEHPKLWALTSRTSEVARSLDLYHLFSSNGRLGSSRHIVTSCPRAS
jgi:hypothetical protein